ncbi:uncharacterized protein LOC131152663 isoform X2 [Malania oleifera]|uniref:uncharacterized protein LOC131152663 isoform X2 n=1 Tax=Malania oleifera TaxID=397392 RepID=UPI0025AE90EB|nr:uncharacterized protein LOC131152663 isoform X2 [Malania oleifera]
MALTIPTHSILKFLHPQHQVLNTHRGRFTAGTKRITRTILTKVSSNGGGDAVDATPQRSVASDVKGLNGGSSSFGDGDVAMFVQMLGLDNDPLDREQAIIALWKYSLGGKQYVDSIMQFSGSLNLIVNLLNSDSRSTCEAAAGLLQVISSVNLHRDSVLESGAIEEITGLLSQSSLAVQVKEQSICTLRNLSLNEELRVKIANTELLPLLVNSLDDEDLKVKEAAGGVLANLALSHSNHKIMVEAGAIPQLAKLLKMDVEGSKVIRKVARNALLELSEDEYYRILIIEEGLVLVPIIGAAAYKSFRPVSHSWPSLPDGTEFEMRSKGPSRYGASELLLGLNIDGNDVNIDKTKVEAIIGQTRQQFLARIGAIELEDGEKSRTKSSISQQFTLLPWMDGIARLVLILGLEDESAILKAAELIADACINEHIQIAFKEAGAIKYLVRLLDHKNNAVKLAATGALERLSSKDGYQGIEAESAMYPPMNTHKHLETSESLTEKN